MLSNAIKYTPPEGTVSITLDPRDNELCVQVQDSGYGIPVDELPFVFDRFHRVSSHQKLAAGTGLGLAITRAFVEAHEGRIEVTSKMDMGSTFTMHLPILQPDPPNKAGDVDDKRYHQPGVSKQQNRKVTPFISY
mgnify:FL=1